jgi:muramoyltetrapeptide carboxypeptidase
MGDIQTTKKIKDKMLTRRNLLKKGLAATAVLPFVPIATGKSPKKKASLSSNTIKTHTLGLIHPSGKIGKQDWQDCLDFFEKRKTSVVSFSLEESNHPLFSGDLQQKKQQFSKVLENTKYLFASKGGSGSIHLLDFIQEKWNAQAPFTIIGFSDVSPLLNFLASRLGQITMHSHNAISLKKKTLAEQDFFFQRLQGNWQGELAGADFRDLTYFGDKLVKAKLLGGNLASLTSLVGTPYQSPLDNSILFVEDISEPYYRVERLFSQLHYAGSLKNIKGLVLGHFLWEEEKLEPKKILHLIQDFLPKDIPIIVNFPAGHGEKNAPLPIGAKVILDAGKKSFACEKEFFTLL